MGTACSSAKKPDRIKTEETQKPDKTSKHERKESNPSNGKEKTSSKTDKQDTKAIPPSPINAKKKDSIKKVINNEEEIKIDSTLLVQNVDVNPQVHYDIIENLGPRPYGNLYLVKHKEAKQKRIMKEISVVKGGKEKDVIAKFEVLKKFDHPKVVKIFEIYSFKGSYFVIHEFFELGTIDMVMRQKGPFKEGQVANIIFQVLMAVNYAHNNDIMHRNLTPDLVLVEEIDKTERITINVSDFGTMASIEGFLKNSKKKIGNMNYMSPETMNNQPFDKKSDIWSVGIMTYYLLSGTLPFDGDDEASLTKNITTGNLKLKGPLEKVSSLCKDFLKKMLDKDLKKRPAANEALQHKWFVKFQLKDKNTIVEANKMKNFMENLAEHSTNMKLQSVCIALIVHNLPPNDEIKDLEKAFTSMDENFDGKLSKAELITGFKNVFKNKSGFNAETQVESIFNAVDTDKTGFISYEEFICACIDKGKLLTDKNLKLAFNCLDDNNSGYITAVELNNILCGGGDNQVSEKMIKSLMDEIDTVDSDGRISFAEFKNMMTKILH